MTDLYNRPRLKVSFLKWVQAPHPCLPDTSFRRNPSLFSFPIPMALAGNSAVESDIASELLVAELVLNDIAAVQATRKGKAREDAPRSDEDIAFDVQATSLNAFLGILHDYQFASSIDRAIESDTSQLASLALVDRVEHDDHRAAVALGGGHDLPRQTWSQRMMERTLAHSARSMIQTRLCTASIDHSQRTPFHAPWTCQQHHGGRHESHRFEHENCSYQHRGFGSRSPPILQVRLIS